jgi:hypothetical protein
VIFNLRSKDRIRLVFHNELTPNVNCELFEGDYADGRRLVYIAGADAVNVSKARLQQAIQDLIQLIDQAR